MLLVLGYHQLLSVAGHRMRGNLDDTVTQDQFWGKPQQQDPGRFGKAGQSATVRTTVVLYVRQSFRALYIVTWHPSLSSFRRAGAGISRRAPETSTPSAESRVNYGRYLRKRPSLKLTTRC